jgi:competence protein ComEA
MAPSPTHPLWGWTPAARLWLSSAGVIAGVGLIALGGVRGSDLSIPPPPRLVVDPNTAPPAVLAALPHLGPAMIKRIVAARERTPFQSLDDLNARVRGIGPATFGSLSPFLQLDRPAAESRPEGAVEPHSRAPATAAATARVHLARTP